jgi:ACS family tartrate transporter-like MFS transporter
VTDRPSTTVEERAASAWPASARSPDARAPDARAPAARALAKARWRLLPLLFVLYVVAYLDRINVGFAALQMNAAIGLGAAAYGLGAGMFFVSYTAFEIPSNLMLLRLGARVWIARIMITWGAISAAMMFVRGETSFYVLRFLLGAAEAGFFPGIIFYLTAWFPPLERARATAYFMTATALSGLIGGPVSGALLALDGAFGLAGWQWMFFVEGLPAVALGLLVLARLPDGPHEARWLAPEERAALQEYLAREQGGSPSSGPRHETLRGALGSGRVWGLAGLYFTIVIGLYGISFWLPQILRSQSGWSDVRVSVLSALPYLAAAVGMVMVAAHSDRTGERRWHVAGCTWAAALGFVAATETPTAAGSLAALSLAAIGVWGAFGPFWALPPTFLSGRAAAGGIALVNSVGNLGGFAGPALLGLVRERTGAFEAGLWLVAATLAVGGLLALAVPHARRR